MKEKIHFQCITTCSFLCCGGATIITLQEISKVYRFFPITIGFIKIYPVNNIHREYLKDITFNYKNFFIIGDFIAGNRFKEKCKMLKDSLCTLHGGPKPLQCRIVPFSVTFPEEMQDLVIKERRNRAFKKCEGFKENLPLVWDGSFKSNELKTAFYSLRENISNQRELMEKIFASLQGNPVLSRFIISPDGLFEIPVPNYFFEELLTKASIKSPGDFLRSQKQLFVNELKDSRNKDLFIMEALKNIEQMLS